MPVKNTVRKPVRKSSTRKKPVRKSATRKKPVRKSATKKNKLVQRGGNTSKSNTSKSESNTSKSKKLDISFDRDKYNTKLKNALNILRKNGLLGEQNKSGIFELDAYKLLDELDPLFENAEIDKKLKLKAQEELEHYFKMTPQKGGASASAKPQSDKLQSDVQKHVMDAVESIRAGDGGGGGGGAGIDLSFTGDGGDAVGAAGLAILASGAGPVLQATSELVGKYIGTLIIGILNASTGTVLAAVATAMIAGKLVLKSKSGEKILEELKTRLNTALNNAENAKMLYKIGKDYIRLAATRRLAKFSSKIKGLFKKVKSRMTRGITALTSGQALEREIVGTEMVEYDPTEQLSTLELAKLKAGIRKTLRNAGIRGVNERLIHSIVLSFLKEQRDNLSFILVERNPSRNSRVSGRAFGAAY